jgi:hypothetical protein
MEHNTQHPKAGQTVKIHFKEPGHFQLDGLDHEFRLEDWWDRINGVSWMFSDGNPAAMVYGMRSGLAQLPINDQVVYGKIGNYGHLVHESEIITE